MSTPTGNTSPDAYDPGSDPLVAKVTASVKKYMSRNDASHDWAHIQRVVGLARHLCRMSPAALDARLVELGALLHDVGDRKYTTAEAAAADPEPVKTLLLSFGAEPALAETVQQVCGAVSWTTEKKDPARVVRVMAAHPELACVQDADRLDAIGAVGVARMFTYGGATYGSGASASSRGLNESMEHLDEKLIHIQERLKTDAGKELGRKRTERLLEFRAWYAEEASFAMEDTTDVARAEN